MIKKIALCLIVLLATSGLAYAEQKLGVVDLQRVLLESEKGKTAKQTIGKKVAELDGKLKAERDALKKMKDDIEAQSPMLKEDARAKKMRDYEDRVTRFKRMAKDGQTTVQNQDAELTRSILKDVFKVVERVGEKQGYTLILEKSESRIMFADDAINITEIVIKEYNAQSAGK